MRQWFLHGMLKVALVAGAVIALSTAEARQMLYCYDFEGVGANQEIYTAGLNKGTGLLDLVDKRGRVKCQNGGALGSAYALLEENAKSALWLGDGNSALCSGLSGFTMSFWVNAPATTTAWWDFFGFRFGGS